MAKPLLSSGQKEDVARTAITIVKRIDKMKNFHGFPSLPSLKVNPRSASCFDRVNEYLNTFTLLVSLSFRLPSTRTTMRTYLRDLFRNGRYIFLGTILERLSFFVAFVVIARTSAPEVYGIVVASFAFCNLTHTLFDAGLSIYFQRESSNPRKDLSSELSTALWSKVLSFVPYLAVTILYFVSQQSNAMLSTVLIAAVVFGFGIVSVLNAVMFGKSLYKESLLIQFTARMAVLVIIPLFGILHAPVESILLVLILSVGLQLVLLGRYVIANRIWNIQHFNSKVLWTIVRHSAPMGIGLLLVAIYDRVDVLVIQKTINLAAVASYSVAYSLYKLPLIVSGVVLVPTYTSMSSYFADHDRIPVDMLSRVGSLLLATGLILGIALRCFAGKLLFLFYGPQYVHSANVLGLLAIGLPALFLNHFTGTILNAMRKERLAMTAAAIGTFTNILCLIWLIPKFGIIGAAVATVVTEFAMFFAEITFVIRHHNLLGHG
jgi:O-antigen/teichoic acid export membrane protein